MQIIAKWSAELRGLNGLFLCIGAAFWVVYCALITLGERNGERER